MPNQTIAADVCLKMVEATSRSCQAGPPVTHEQTNPNWDAMAASFASLSNAFAWGSLILALVAFLAAFAWGRVVTARAEREARKIAQKCADAEMKKWLKQKAPPLIKRQVTEFLGTMGFEGTISDDDLAKLVAAAGVDGKEGENGKK